MKLATLRKVMCDTIYVIRVWRDGQFIEEFKVDYLAGREEAFRSIRKADGLKRAEVKNISTFNGRMEIDVAV